jgi:hypothetical protein
MSYLSYHMSKYVLSSVLWCPLRFPCENDVRFVFNPNCLKKRLMSYACYLCMFAQSGVQHFLIIGVPWRVSYKRQALLTLHRNLGSPRFFGGIRVALLFSFLWCFFFFCVSFVCLLPVSCVPYDASFSGLSII